jgi:AcrR family transcriptional regulator
VVRRASTEQTREQLIRAAAVQFDRHGFAGATIDEVGRAAGLTKGAIYFHFTSKEELAGAVQAEACRMLRSSVDELVATGRGGLQSLVDVSQLLVMWSEREPRVRASLRIARERDERGGPPADFLMTVSSVVDRLVRHAGLAAELSPRTTEDVLRAFVLTVCLGFTAMWHDPPIPRPARILVAGLWNLIIPAIAARPDAVRLDPHGSMSTVDDLERCDPLSRPTGARRPV